MSNDMRKLLLGVLLLCSAAQLRAVEPLRLGFVIHGRAPLMPAPNPQGLVESGVFAGDTIQLSAMLANAPSVDDDSIAKSIRWTITTFDGREVTTEPTFVASSRPEGPLPEKLRSAKTFRYQITNLEPGRYIITATWRDELTTESRILTVYMGDETTRVRQEFLRHSARSKLREGTQAAYRDAKGMLLEAAKDNRDPNVLEELADASTAWVTPDETAGYYKRSVELARRNLDSQFGSPQKWPDAAAEHFGARERKVTAFNELVPYYKLHFDEVRIVVVSADGRDQFAVERRKDGARIRLVDPK